MMLWFVSAVRWPSSTARIPSDLYMCANVSGKPFYSELPSGNLRQLYSHEILDSKAGNGSRSLYVLEKWRGGADPALGSARATERTGSASCPAGGSIEQRSEQRVSWSWLAALVSSSAMGAMHAARFGPLSCRAR